MRVEATVNGKTFTVSLEETAASPRVQVEGREVGADVAWVSATELLLSIDGRSHDTVVRPAGPDSLTVQVGARTLVVSLGGGEGRGPAAARLHSGQILQSPMPGKIVAVLVEEGEKVEVGRGLVVMEAMKMENELQASAAGLVKRVHVRPGQVVELGANLVEITAE